MAHRSRLLTIFLISVAILDLNQTVLASANDKNDVGIYPPMALQICNKMSGDVLNTHCKSGDNDFGMHTVAVNGCETWNFRPDVAGTTLYLCAVGSQSHGSVQFTPYDQKRDFPDRCKSTCLWNVDDSGVHGFTEKGSEDTTIAWIS